MARLFQESRFNAQFLDEKGEVKQAINITQKQLEDLTAEQKGANRPEPEVTKQQTFARAEATTLADISEIVPNEAAAVAHFNRGASIAQAAVIREFMTDETQPAVDGVFDVVAEIQTPSEGRRKLSDTEKAAKLLGMKPEDLAAIIASVKGAAANASPELVGASA